ncbi:DUF4197 domain-containing protein [Parvularcula marina]|uniref:DUF4197 domain-containing protein n=1 Tax=Parvularcula marina TaxID=2292771 RepID=UPI003518C431
MTMKPTRRYLLGLLPAGLLAACTTAEQEAILGAVLSGTGTTGGTSGVTSAEAAQGIRAALEQGILSAIAQVGRNDGYFRDGRIHIPLPSRLASIQSQLRPLGLSGLLDDLELQINRGAEVAAPQAKSIFLDAIRSLSISDAIGIVNGGPTSATDYFERRTTPALTSLFTPVMESALQRAGAIQTFDNLVASLRNVPLAPQLGADAKNDLIEHGVGKGLDGLFYYIGQEEAAIRSNPAKRTSEILKRVFG